ncbi:MAG: hypothetical protein ACXWP4_12680 [Polyangiales bacterium]
MRPFLAVALALVAALGSKVAHADDEAPLEPARTGIQRFEDHHHELGVVYGVGGPLSGAGRYAVSGLRYHENNGELLDAFFSAIFKVMDSKWNKRVDCSGGACVFLDATAYLPHLLGDRDEPGVKGGIVEFGLSVPTRKLVFQVGASIGFVSARVPDAFVGNARDALMFALHAPIGSWLTVSARVDLNVFALYPSKVMKEWRTDSPITLGVDADLGRRVYASAAFIRGDLIKGGEGWQLGLGLRF